MSTLLSAEWGSAEHGALPLGLQAFVRVWVRMSVGVSPPPPSRSPTRRGALGSWISSPSPKPSRERLGGSPTDSALEDVSPSRVLPWAMRRWRLGNPHGA